jgi:hypothetical protein
MEAWFETRLLNSGMGIQEYLKVAYKSPGILYCVVVPDNSIRLGIYITDCEKNLDVFNIMIQLKNKSKIYTFHRITKFNRVEKTIPNLYSSMEINIINLETGDIEEDSKGKLIHIEERYLMERGY